MPNGRRFEFPSGLSREEERSIIAALERYFLQESPHPDPWVLAGRMDSTGLGALQTKRQMDAPWRTPSRAPFARRGVPPLTGRGDAN